MLKIILFYLRLIRLSGDELHSKESVAGKKLMSPESFRIPSGTVSVVRILLAGYKRALIKSFRNVNTPFVVNAEGIEHVAVWDNNPAALKARVVHIGINGEEMPGVLIARELSSPRGIVTAVLAIFWITLFIPVFLIMCLKKRPVTFGLLPEELVEAYGLLQTCRITGVQKLYFYCPYECDANAMYLLLASENVRVCKIPSPNLLSIHNSMLVTDDLALTSPYQQDELEQLKSTLVYNRIVHWVPEHFAQYHENYRKRASAPTGSIGYYSHGSWMRKELNLADSGVGDTVAEEELLGILAAISKEHADFTITVFLHPKEKKHPSPAAVHAFYESVFGKNKFVIADPASPGAMLFDSVDIGLGAISTILFERMFLGCKTLFFPAGVKSFPLSDSKMKTICAFNKSELLAIIGEMKSCSTSEFLQRKDLMRYTIHNWRPELDYGRKD